MIKEINIKVVKAEKYYYGTVTEYPMGVRGKTIAVLLKRLGKAIQLYRNVERRKQNGN